MEQGWLDNITVALIKRSKRVVLKEVADYKNSFIDWSKTHGEITSQFIEKNIWK